MNSDPAFQKLVAYLTLGMIMFLFSRTPFGYKTIYYALWLIIIGLILQNAFKVAKLIEPITKGSDDAS